MYRYRKKNNTLDSCFLDFYFGRLSQDEVIMNRRLSLQCIFFQHVKPQCNVHNGHEQTFSFLLQILCLSGSVDLNPSNQHMSSYIACRCVRLSWPMPSFMPPKIGVPLRESNQKIPSMSDWFAFSRWSIPKKSTITF